MKVISFFGSVGRNPGLGDAWASQLSRAFIIAVKPLCILWLNPLRTNGNVQFMAEVPLYQPDRSP